MPTPPRVIDPPAWAESLSIPRSRTATVTPQEATYAAALINEWHTAAGVPAGALSPSQLNQLRARLMAGLAEARDGATLPGARTQMDVVLDVTGYLWRDQPDTALQARRRLWTRWAHDLAAQGLRPLGWPVVDVTFLRYRDHTLDPGPTRDLFVETDEDHADLVRLHVGGLAVRA